MCVCVCVRMRVYFCSENCILDAYLCFRIIFSITAIINKFFTVQNSFKTEIAISLASMYSEISISLYCIVPTLRSVKAREHS